MFVYFKIMRVKDDQKYKAITAAAISLINREGFATASMSKIAKEAGVSPATIYVYFENKEDLLKKTYLMVKSGIAEKVFPGIDFNQPVDVLFRSLWFKFYNYFAGHIDYFIFTEQFANSPIVDTIDQEEIEAYFEPMMSLISRGQREGIIKNIPHDIIIASGFYPLLSLLKNSCKGRFDLTEENLELLYQAAWDSIKA